MNKVEDLLSEKKGYSIFILHCSVKLEGFDDINN